jgi:hypothetical protein
MVRFSGPRATRTKAGAGESGGVDDRSGNVQLAISESACGQPRVANELKKRGLGGSACAACDSAKTSRPWPSSRHIKR